MSKQYRNNGAVGAILDEYEKSITEIDPLIIGLSNEELITIVDDKTEDSDCKSIQTILTHLIMAGYNYVIEIRKSFGEKIDFVDHKSFNTPEQYRSELKEMFNYNEQLFKDYPNLSLEEFDPNKQILVKWGKHYDIEQLFEHAIVHVLRHRRQIEKFLLRLKQKKG